MKIILILMVVSSILYNLIKFIVMSKEDLKFLIEMIKNKIAEFNKPKPSDGYLEWKELCREKRIQDQAIAAKMHKASYNDVTRHVHTELRKK